MALGAVAAGRVGRSRVLEEEQGSTALRSQEGVGGVCAWSEISFYPNSSSQGPPRGARSGQGAREAPLHAAPETPNKCPCSGPEDILFLQVKGLSLPRAPTPPKKPMLLRLESKAVFRLPLCPSWRKPRQLQEKQDSRSHKSLSTCLLPSLERFQRPPTRRSHGGAVRRRQRQGALATRPRAPPWASQA